MNILGLTGSLEHDQAIEEDVDQRIAEKLRQDAADAERFSKLDAMNLVALLVCPFGLDERRLVRLRSLGFLDEHEALTDKGKLLVANMLAVAGFP